MFYAERVQQVKLAIFTLILSSLLDVLRSGVTEMLWNVSYECIGKFDYKPAPD